MMCLQEHNIKKINFKGGGQQTDNRELLIIHSVILVVCPEFVCVPCWISVLDFLMQ
jgi:hypothetical protein